MKASYLQVFFFFTRLCKEDLKINRKGVSGDYHKNITTLPWPRAMTKQHKMQHARQHKNEWVEWAMAGTLDQAVPEQHYLRLLERCSVIPPLPALIDDMCNNPHSSRTVYGKMHISREAMSGLSCWAVWHWAWLGWSLCFLRLLCANPLKCQGCLR